MESIIDLANKFVSKITLREDIAGRLLNLHNLKEEIKVPKDYFFITDITAPADMLISKKFKKKKSQELKNILSQGSKIHTIVQNWLRQHKDYLGSEGILDGCLIGIPVRGRIDGRINESIVEIKSIKDLPKTSEEILENYPQYLEQVAFYSVIDPLQPKENYLVFITQQHPYLIKTFKVSILNLDSIRNTLKKRIHTINEILNGKKDASALGKCRYCYPEKCEVKNDGNCHLFDIKPLVCEIKESIKIEEDLEFTSELENLKKKFGESYNLFSSFELLCPRKSCLKELYNLPEEFNNSACKTYFGDLIYRLRKKEKSLEKQEKSKLEEFELNKYNWFNDVNSINKEGKHVPFVRAVTNSRDFDKPSDYKIAEIGLYLMAYGLTKGMVFCYYPKKEQIKVFEITFNFEGSYMSKLKETIEKLKNPKDYSSLPKCPDYMCSNCPYKQYC